MGSVMASDPELGMQIHELLVEAGLETPFSELTLTSVQAQDGHSSALTVRERESCIQSHFSKIMYGLGLDLTDDSLRETPKRVAKMFCHEVFSGLDYGNFPKCTTIENKMQYQEMVCVNQIAVQSMCEHHFLPFVGYATIAYLPDTKVLGLSKFNRVTDFFARRPQVQERLTEQISLALRYILSTEDVAVVIRAEHFCTKLRGVRDVCSDTVTSRLAGKFRTVSELRAEFLALSRKS